MRIAVDARELAGQPTGVGRYLIELLASWSRDSASREHEIALYATEKFDLPSGLLGSEGARVSTEYLPGRSGTSWEQFTLRRAVRHRADVLFCPGYSAPVLATVPFVVAIHDLSFWAHPEWFGWRERLRRRSTTALAARRAARILTISEFSRSELFRWLRVPASRVVVTHLAPARWLTAIDRSPPPAAPATREPLVLYVGSLLNRRHLPTLVRAFEPVARSLPGARLVIVGDNRTFPREDPASVARELGIADRVDVRSYVPEAELSALYRRASAFAFLSEYEGFGLTPLEAMAAGVPVVAYGTAVAREVYGDAAWLVRPGDADGVTAALRATIADQAVRARLLASAEVCLARWSWDVTARTTMDVLEEAAGTRRR